MSQRLRELRASPGGRFFGTSADGKTIRIWDAQTLQEIRCVEPGFSGGKWRFIIEPERPWIFSGTWEGGLSCVDYMKGLPVWSRSDLVGVQGVSVSEAFRNSVFVWLESPDHRENEPGIFTGVVELDASTGRLLWTEDAHEVYLHPRLPWIVLVDRLREEVKILDETRCLVGSIHMTHFAVLDVAFADDAVALSEGAKGVRIIDSNAALIASYLPKDREASCQEITFIEGADLLAVHSWGSYVTLLDYAGEVANEYRRDCHGSICFINGGAQFVDEAGRVFSTLTGKHDKSLTL